MAVKSLDSVLRYLHRATGGADADALTDGQLLERFVAGHDQAAFELLVRRHGPLVWGVCRRLLFETHDAEDAFQATFLVLVRRARSLERRPSLANWLYGVATRVAWKASKAKSRLLRRFTHDQDIADLPEATMAAETDWREVRLVLDAELSQLPEKFREPLVLCYLEGMTNEQAARELGCPAGSMSKMLARGRELLHERLARQGVALSAAGLGAMLVQNAAAAAPPGAVVELTTGVAALVAGKGTTVGLASEPVSQLTEGVLRTMFFSKLPGLSLAVAACIALTAGFSGSVAQQKSAVPKAPSVAPHEVMVTDTEIITPHDKIPRFKGLLIKEDTTFDKPRTEKNIEIEDDATLTVSSELRVNTITLLGSCAKLSLLPGCTIRFEGPIADAGPEGLQFGRGIINLGTVEARGTPVKPWKFDGKQYVWSTDHDIKLIGEERAHTMSMGMGIYDLEYVHFSGMGRTTVQPIKPGANQIGRYPLHVHRGHGGVSKIKGCLITDFRRWGLALHDTRQSHLVEENVFVGEGPKNPVNGAGVVTEMGTEYGATVRKNLSINIHGVARKFPAGDEGFEGHGFWFHGIAGLTCEDNVAVNCGDTGFSNFTPRNPRSIQVDKVTLSGQDLIPKSWKRNAAIRCGIGVDQWPEFRTFSYDDQICDGCKSATRLFGGNVLFVNQKWTNCDVGFRPFGYVGTLHLTGGEVSNCKDIGGGHAFDTQYKDVTFRDNGADIVIRGMRWASSIVIDVPRTPTVVYAPVGDQFFRQVSERWRTAETRILKTPEGQWEIRSPIELADQPYPDGGQVFVEPTTVQQAWDKWNVGINGRVPAQQDKAIYKPEITDGKGTKVPLLPVVDPPKLPLKAYVGKMDLKTGAVRTMFGGGNIWDSKTDVAELWVDGERRHRGSWAPTVIATKLTGAKDVELRLFRDGKLISSHARKLDAQ